MRSSKAVDRANAKYWASRRKNSHDAGLAQDNSHPEIRVAKADWELAMAHERVAEKITAKVICGIANLVEKIQKLSIGANDMVLDYGYSGAQVPLEATEEAAELLACIYGQCTESARDTVYSDYFPPIPNDDVHKLAPPRSTGSNMDPNTRRAYRRFIAIDKAAWAFVTQADSMFREEVRARRIHKDYWESVPSYWARQVVINMAHRIRLALKDFADL